MPEGFWYKFTMPPKSKSDGTRSTANAPVVPIREAARKLEDLYARHAAIQAVIQSLEDYQRFRATDFDPENRKTA